MFTDNQLLRRLQRYIAPQLFWVVVLSFCYTVILSYVFNLRPRSAAISAEGFNSSPYLTKKIAMYKVLARYNSPFVTEVDSFLKACLLYRLDCYLLPSISGVESTFGQQYLHGTYNPFGWGGGYIVFESWEHAFSEVAKGLRFNYFNRNLTSVEAIAHVYAPPSTTWARNVQYFMRRFELEEATIVQPILDL